MSSVFLCVYWCSKKDWISSRWFTDVKDIFYSDWLAYDCCVITWFLNSMEKVSSSLYFLRLLRRSVIYENEKNIFRVFKLYECMFTCQLGEMSVSIY